MEIYLGDLPYKILCDEHFHAKIYIFWFHHLAGFQTVTSLQSRTKRLRLRVVPFREQFANYVRATLPRRAPIIANVTTPMASSLCGDFASDRSDTKSDSEEPAPGGAEKSPQPAPGATGNTSTTAKRRVCSLGRGRTR